MSAALYQVPAGTQHRATCDSPLQSFSGRGLQAAGPKTSAIPPRAGPSPGCHVARRLGHPLRPLSRSQWVLQGIHTGR